jgi:hypothetical protein
VETLHMIETAGVPIRCETSENWIEEFTCGKIETAVPIKSNVP